MIKDNRVLIIGGAGRNVGKTEFVCRLINKFSTDQEVFGLKVSTIFPDEELFHGNHDSKEPKHHIFEETRRETAKDTSRMLRAGAKKVFYLRSDDSGIKTSFNYFRKELPDEAIIVCESNSLAQAIHPGLYVMVRSIRGAVKPRAVAQLDRADLIVVSDGSSGFAEIETIEFNDEHGWFLKK